MKTMPAGMVLLFRDKENVQVCVLVDPGNFPNVAVLPHLEGKREVC